MEKLLVIELCAITKLASLNSTALAQTQQFEMARLQNIEWAAYEAAHPCAKKGNHSYACCASIPRQIQSGGISPHL